MSSLAGALDAHDAYDASMPSPKVEDDIDESRLNMDREDSPEDNKEALNDLFGEDEDVNMIEHEYVLS